MEKKVLHIGEDYIERAILDMDNELYFVNELFSLLLQFDVHDPSSIRNPVEAVNKKLKESVKHGNFETPIENILNLIGKQREYNNIKALGRRLRRFKYLDYFVCKGDYFTKSATAEQEIRTKLTPYIDDPRKIIFAEKVENLIDEAFELANEAGVNIERDSILRSFHANRVNGKTILSPSDYLNNI